MSGETFLHGIEVIEIDDGTRPIETQRSSVIGIVGTAPEADPAKFPYNTPVLVAGSRREAAFLGNLGTLPSAMDAIFDQTGALVVVIRVPSTGTETETLTRGVAPADMTETLTQAAVYVSKVYDNAKTYVKGTDYTVDGNTITWINKATATRPANAAEYSVDFEVALTAAQVKSNIIGGVDTATGQYKGLQALLAAQSVAKVSPKILAVPEFSQYLEVASELIGIAERIKAVMIVDGPSTNDADAISYRENFGSPRVYIIDPRVKKWDTAANDYRFFPSSPCVAGLISKTDNEKGFWWSPSNQVINGIVGTERAIDHYIDDPNCRANYLNEHEVATIVQAEGYRLWGNRTASADIKWAFLNVRRTADMVNQSILHAHRWAIDRNITKTLVEDVLEGVNAYIRHLKKVGAIINGKAWADPEMNTPDQVMQGKLYIDFEFTPNYPCEHLIFRSHLVGDYLVEIFARAA